MTGGDWCLLDLSIPFFKPDCNPAFESDFWRNLAQFGWSSGFSLSANKLKFELQQNEKDFSRFT
jgi:hypothetical protein